MENVKRVDLLTKLEAITAGGKEGNVAVANKRAHTEPPRIRGKSCLSPLLVIGDKTRKLFEAFPTSTIELPQGLGMKLWWND